jgi:hypothetical protein
MIQKENLKEEWRMGRLKTESETFPVFNENRSCGICPTSIPSDALRTPFLV